MANRHLTYKFTCKVRVYLFTCKLGVYLFTCKLGVYPLLWQTDYKLGITYKFTCKVGVYLFTCKVGVYISFQLHLCQLSTSPHLRSVTSPVSPVTCHLSQHVTCHLLLTCHLSPVTCHLHQSRRGPDRPPETPPPAHLLCPNKTTSNK